MGDLDQRQLIENIRARYTDPEDADLMLMIENMLHILAERLNRTDIHFVAELVQNAEDAGLRWDRPEVHLRFLIDAKKIVAQNDGYPFDDEDVRSICRAAASSKRHAENQIGFMGIGFKSVFKIASAPEVHSNGFHFRLERYIYPAWLDAPSSLPDRDMQSAFVLPLKPEVDVERLASQFNHLDPAMILFLNKLKSIEIDNRVTGEIHVIEARAAADGLVVLESLEGCQSWRTAKFDIPQSINAFRPKDRLAREDVEMQIACMVDSHGRFKRAKPSLFFAFLPTDQETGLGFHLQADFVPTADRENIEDNRWNQVLLEYAGRYLVQQLIYWRDGGGHDLDLYNLVPLESEAKEIAQVVAQKVKEHAAGERLIWTRNQKWVVPQHALRLEKATYAPVLDLLDAAAIAAQYDQFTDFVHEDTQGRHMEVVKSLGVPVFGLTDLCGMLGNEELLAQKSLEWLADLFLFLYRFREDLQKAQLVEKVRGLSLVPLTDRSRAAVRPTESGQQIFLPLKAEMADSYALFQGRLNLVAQDLLDVAQRKGQGEDIIECLEWLGIQPFEPYPVVRDVILPIFDGDEWQVLDDRLHFAYLDFVRRHWHTYREEARASGDADKAAIEHVAKSLWFQCKSSPDEYARAPELLLSQNYEPEDDLEVRLQDVPGLSFVTDQYAIEEHQARARQAFAGPSWSEFLRDLGAVHRFDVMPLIDRFILPQFRNDSWKVGHWFALTNFIRLHLEDYQRARQAVENQKSYGWRRDPLIDLKQYLWVQSTDVREEVHYFNRPGKLYLPRTYGESVVPTAFEDLLADNYVSDTYLARSAEGRNEDERRMLQRSWREFFDKVGVLHCVPLLPRQGIGEADYPGCNTLWQPHSRRWGKVSDRWHDVIGELLRILGQAQDPKREHRRARAFLRMLDQHWAEVYQPARTATYSWFYYTDRTKSIPSAFEQVLRQRQWVPTKAGTLVKPGTVLFAAKFESEVGDPLQICAEEVRNEQLRAFLGIRTELNVEDVMSLLAAAGEREAPELEHLRSLYKWLQDHWDDVGSLDQWEVKRAFADGEPLIYLPDLRSWRSSQKCTWIQAPFSLIASHRPALSETYDGLRTLFVEHLEVREHASGADYLEVLAQDVAEEPVSPEEYDAIWRVYAEIEKLLANENPDIEAEVEKHYDSTLWLCEDGGFRPRNEVYVNDNHMIHQLFGAEIHYLWLPPGQPPSAAKHLIAAFDLARLSTASPELMEDQLVVSGSSDEWSNHIAALIEPVLRYLYTYDHPAFRELWNAGAVSSLLNLTAQETQGEIPVQYRLAHGETAGSSQSLFVALEADYLYVSPRLAPDDPAISREFCRAIGLNLEVQNFMDSVLPRLRGDGLGRYIQEKGLSPLPADIEQRLHLWRPLSTIRTGLGDWGSSEPDTPAPIEEGSDEVEQPGAGASSASDEMATDEERMFSVPEGVPSFEGEVTPRVPTILTDWRRLRQDYGDIVDKDIDALDRLIIQESSKPQRAVTSWSTSPARITLTFMNRTLGFLHITPEMQDHLLQLGQPTELQCQTDYADEFSLYADYDRLILYNQHELPRFFEANNIPAGGIVYLAHVHERTVRLYFKQADGIIREIRCAELQPDGSLEYFFIESAEYPCEVAEFVVRAEKRLEDPGALFAEAVGKKSVFETMINVFEEFGPELSLEEIFTMVSALRMVAFSTIRGELQQHLCFVNLGSGRWGFEPERGLKRIMRTQTPESTKQGTPVLSGKSQTLPPQPWTGVVLPPASDSVATDPLRQQLRKWLEEIQALVEQQSPTTSVMEALEMQLWNLLDWLDGLRSAANANDGQ